MNIKKIAELANVSIATVSRVINNKPGVRAEIRTKVEQIIRQSDYRPNLMARGLVQKKSNVIGLMVPRFDGYYSERVEAILKVCHENGYGVMIASALKDYEDELDNLGLLYEKHVEGLIFFAAHWTPELNAMIRKISERTPVVMVDQVIEELNIPSILQDNYNGARQAVQHLIECGHRRIACISAPSSDPEGERRLEAFVDTMKEHNLPVEKRYIRQGLYSIESGCNEMEKLLAEPEKPTAVFTANDNMAIGAINCIIKQGLNVPDDISVVGFDDILISRHFNPSLTTVRQDQVAVGTAAAELMLEYIRTKRVRVKKVILTQELVTRDSVKKLETGE